LHGNQILLQPHRNKQMPDDEKNRARINPVIAYVNFVVIPVEERHLRAAFGVVYQEYGARVRRWL